MDTKIIVLEREPICILKKGFYDVNQADYFLGERLYGKLGHDSDGLIFLLQRKYIKSKDIPLKPATEKRNKAKWTGLRVVEPPEDGLDSNGSHKGLRSLSRS